jgi:ABC-type transporter Mla MlaB component
MLWHQEKPRNTLALDLHWEGRVEGVELMIRVSVTESTGNAVTLLVEGKVIGDAVDELNSCCDQALAEGRRLTLDVAGVSFMDRKAVALLHRLAAHQVSVVNCSAFVAEQLKVRDPG